MPVSGTYPLRDKHSWINIHAVSIISAAIYKQILFSYFFGLFSTHLVRLKRRQYLDFFQKYFFQISDITLLLNKKLQFLLEKVCRIKIVLHESKSNKSKVFTNSSIVIMNHRTRLDWLFYFCILYRLNSLSKIKIILKDALKKIPGPGFYLLFLFVNFLKF